MQFFPRSLFVFIFCIPLAVVFGIMLATPLDRTSMIIIGSAFFLLLTPILLVKHQAFLIFSMSAYINIYFLPGQPQLWLLATAVSSLFAVLTWTVNRTKMRLINVPSLTWGLLFLFLVTCVTAQATGGTGARILGSSQFGGRRYISVWAAILAYFAISAFPVPTEKRKSYTLLFFLAGVTSAVGNLAFALGPNFYFLFLLFPPEWAIFQASEDTRVMLRINGLFPAALAIISFMLVRYGLRGIVNLRYWWRGVIVLTAFVLGLCSGFRSVLVMVMILFAVQFWLEGLHKTRWVFVGLGVALLLAGAVVPFANRLPLSVQRCLTVFPLDLDRAAIDDAQGSSQWRIEMWRALLPDIPKYLWLGKGFAIDPKDLYFAQEGVRFGGASPIDGSIVAGDYHNGPLSVIIPFGIWGVCAFVWFIAASIRALWINYKNSEPEMRTVNTFLLCFFLTKVLFFVVFFGAFYVELVLFTSTIALSISINRGVRTVRREQVSVQPARREPEVTGTWQPA
jgi:hypothetical protein